MGRCSIDLEHGQLHTPSRGLELELETKPNPTSLSSTFQTDISVEEKVFIEVGAILKPSLCELVNTIKTELVNVVN